MPHHPRVSLHLEEQLKVPCECKLPGNATSPPETQLLPREASEWDTLGEARPLVPGRPGLESWLGHWYTGVLAV